MPCPTTTALDRAAAANWAALERIGGGFVATLRRRIDTHQHHADAARQAGDRTAAATHEQAVEDLFEDLETRLSRTQGAR
jgi:hypothetical protein